VIRPLVVVGIALMLTGCGTGAPTPLPSTSSTPINHQEQASIAGEWVVTRTVVSSDDVNNPAHVVGEVSTRLVKFTDVICTDGPCTGLVLSGPTVDVRAVGNFSSSGDVIDYVLTGFLHCIDQATGVVIVPNGYAYTATVRLTVLGTDEVDSTKATTLEGTLSYTDTVTDEALGSGCSREPVATTTEFTLTAVRGAVEAVPTATPAP
jgi:hypothetical protein